MDFLDAILSGFQVALSYQNLLYCFIGVVIGTAIGVLPGLGPTATIALLLPLTYNADAATAIILLAGIYYGAMYGGTITSVLLDLPGEAASVVTTFDGYQMAKQGRAGIALGIAAIGSFVAGTLGIIGLSFFAPILSRFAVQFGPPEYFALTVLGILLVSYLGTKSVIKSMITATLGLMLATIGMDPIAGTTRFTFGSNNAMSGLDFAAIAMGLFGIGEILHNLEKNETGKLVSTKVSRVWPTRKDIGQSKWPILRGSLTGFFIGILPGGGATISSLASYAFEKRISKHPEKFGKGAIEGVAGPESANNAGATSAFIPLLTLGIPANSVMALMFGALLMQGITPGPLLISNHPELFWGVIASMYIGNFFLLMLNIPLVGIFIQMLRVRMSILGPIALLITMIGVYSIGNNSFDMWIVLVFGALGYLMNKFGFEPGPLVLAFVLGPIMERSFRQSMLASHGSLKVFVDNPISGVLLLVSLLLLLTSTIHFIIKSKNNTGTGASM